ncbi:ComF family protein [Robertkochia flava]|uniref:ComF family protein n=1 Tax=Robertkochia flava TaxID=3447986 RepID=UPI001CCF01DB|nr:phosphoribosyltransferase family protein [Robertkochia marina]
MQGAVKILNDLQNLFFPGACLCCRSLLPAPEQFICVKCRHHLPLTDFTNRRDNATERIFQGRFRLEEATSLLWFHKKGPVQNLIHQLKYRGHQKAGEYLGHWLGEEIRLSSRFKDIDLVIPMPLQPKKLRKRGYNQTEKFASALAEHLTVAYRNDLLRRTDRSTSFSLRGRIKRVMESQPLFEANTPELRRYKHVLLTDDVITTGITLESAARAIQERSGIKVSFATIAITA